MSRFTLMTCLVIGSMSHAMGIHTEVSVLAWSSDGTSVLLLTEAHGPEGGGSTTYSIAGSRPMVSFKVSSDFSPGGATQPQTVSLAQCQKLLGTLDKELTARGFDGVTVDTSCPLREGSVKVRHSAPTALPEGWTQTMRGTTLVLSEREHVVLEVAKGMTAFVSPTGRGVAVLTLTNYDSALVGVWARAQAGGPFVAGSK